MNSALSSRRCRSVGRNWSAAAARPTRSRTGSAPRSPRSRARRRELETSRFHDAKPRPRSAGADRLVVHLRGVSAGLILAELLMVFGGRGSPIATLGAAGLWVGTLATSDVRG